MCASIFYPKINDEKQLKKTPKNKAHTFIEKCYNNNMESKEETTTVDQIQLETQVQQEIREGKWCAFQKQGFSEQCTAHPTDIPCPFRNSKDSSMDLLISSIMKEYIQRSTEHLQPQNSIFSENKASIRKIIDQFGIENLLFTDIGVKDDARSQLKIRDFVEESLSRAKPSAKIELRQPFSDDTVDISLAITPMGEQSLLSSDLQKRKINLLSSHDPTAITFLTTINRLKIDDFSLFRRSYDHFVRLYSGDKGWLKIFPSQRLYDRDDGDTERVTYDSIIKQTSYDQ